MACHRCMTPIFREILPRRAGTACFPWEYTLFLEQFPSPVERIYAQEPVLALEEESGKTVRYRYTVETEFYLERRLEEVSPVVQKSFTGTITLKKTGFLKWKMEAFTAG